MKNFKIKLVALMVVVALALTGCVKEDYSIKMLSNGSATITGKVTIDKVAAEDAMRKSFKDMDMSESEINEAIASMWTGYEEDGMKKITVDGKEYYTMTNTQGVKKSELKEVLSTIGSNVYATADTVYLKVDPKNLVQGGAEISSGASNEEIAKAISITFSVELPNNIVKTTGKIDSDNPKKATFNLSLTKKTTVFVTSKEGVSASAIEKANTIAKTKIKKLKANKVKKNAKKATVTLKIKRVKGAKGYQVQWSTKKNFKKASSKKIKKTTYKISKLKKNTKYYVRVRAYKKDMSKDTIYSAWVKKTVKTKK